ncbi:MAG: hypothetical protein IKP73_17330 [Bacteroidales bacterium]|nr:hypothetical protein [Bacteroidales bacterium]
MKKRALIILIVAALAVSELFLLFSNNQLKREVAIKDRYLDQIVDGYDAAETQFSASVADAGKIIDGNIVAKDSADNTITLSEVAKQSIGNILICRYSDFMCRECVKHNISIFMDNKDSLDMKRILFLPRSESRRALKLNFDEYGLQGCRVLNCPCFSIDAEETKFPYIMVVDNDLRILNVYFPTKSTHGTDYDYKHVKMIYDKMIKR